MTAADLDALKRLFSTPQPPDLGPDRRDGTKSEAELTKALKPILSRAGVSERRGELIRALLLLSHDHLDAAHEISQGISDADGSFVHAIMHRREPDAANSKYWWRRVGAHPAFPELASRADQWLRGHGASHLASEFATGGKWDPCKFVDACDGARRLPADHKDRRVLQEIQRLETEVLLGHLAAARE